MSIEALTVTSCKAYLSLIPILRHFVFSWPFNREHVNSSGFRFVTGKNVSKSPFAILSSDKSHDNMLFLFFPFVYVTRFCPLGEWEYNHMWASILIPNIVKMVLPIASNPLNDVL